MWKVTQRILPSYLLGLLAVLAGALCVSVLVSLRKDPSVSATYVGVAANHTGMLAASLVLILILSRGRPASYGLRWPTRFALLPLALLSVGITAAARVVAKLLPGQGLTFTQDYSFPQMVLLVWIYASVAEETLARGLIQGHLAPLSARGVTLGRLRVSVPVLAAAVFFAAMHLGLFTMGIDASTVLQIFVFAFFMGLVAGHYRERTGSLLPAMLAHTLANAAGWGLDTLWK